MNFFYYSVAKKPEDMDKDELVREIHAAYSYYALCRESGQGVNSKEHVRKKNCEMALVKLPGGIDVWNSEFSALAAE